MKKTSDQRIRGIDLARALALLGMMAAHYSAPTDFSSSLWGSLGAITHGRSSLLFAVLAGVSIAIMTGRTHPVEGESLIQARVKLVLRALFILAIGTALESLSSGIAIILPTYAILFIVAILFLRASRKALAWWALGFATLGSAASVLLTPIIYSGNVPIPVAGFIAQGNYSLLPWIALVLAGMILGRTDLTSTKNAVKTGVIGISLACAAYGSTFLFIGLQAPSDNDPSGIVLNSEPTQTEVDPVKEFGTAAKEGATQTFTVNGTKVTGYNLAGLQCDANAWKTNGNVSHNVSCFSEEAPTVEPPEETSEPSYWEQIRDQLPAFSQAAQHSGTPSEIIGGIGVAFFVISLCLLLCTKFSAVFYPLTALGTMPLTMYTAHVISFRFIPASGEDAFNLKWWLISAVVGSVFAMLWKLKFQRGPLEALMTWLIRRFMTVPSPAKNTATNGSPEFAVSAPAAPDTNSVPVEQA